MIQNPVSGNGTTAHAPSFKDLARTFGKIGLLSFGGPAGQIALLQHTLVDDKRWISETRFLHALNFCMLLPGPEAMQLATWCGWMLRGTSGGLIAGLLFIVPGFAAITVLAALFTGLSGTLWLPAMFYGIKAAVLSIVVQAFIRLFKRAVKTRFAAGVAAASFTAIWAFAVPFPVIVIAAAACGAFRPASLQPARVPSPALPPGTTLRTVALWLAIWAAPVATAALIAGPQSVLAAIGLFFSRVSVVTFGGAYAVLAWVAQETVTGQGWLSATDMLNGLALAETTPGPLVLVLCWTGFLAASHASPASPLVSGILGSTMAAWTTFAPCFLWVFAGAPYMEKLAHLRWLSGSLAAVTAAVCGVILNLALWFSLHVLFAQATVQHLGPAAFTLPVLQSLDPVAACLAAAAAIALFRFRTGAAALIAASAIAGLVAKLAL